MKQTSILEMESNQRNPSFRAKKPRAFTTCRRWRIKVMAAPTAQEKLPLVFKIPSPWQLYIFEARYLRACVDSFNQLFWDVWLFLTEESTNISILDRKCHETLE